jgi:hypothetical protein
MLPEIQDYNGKPVICLNPSSKFPFCMGHYKVKMVLDNLDILKKFEEEHRPQPKPQSTAQPGKGKNNSKKAQTETATAEPSNSEDLPF